MHDLEEQDIIALLSQVAEIKTRLRQIESARQMSAGSSAPVSDHPGASAIDRAKKHLELALEALGAPAWGFAATSASPLKITGYHTPDIYKALEDIRSRTRGDEGSASTAASDAQSDAGNASEGSPERRFAGGRRKSDRVSQPWANAKAKRTKKGKKSLKSAAAKPDAPKPQEVEEPVMPVAPDPLTPVESTENSSVWVQHRVDEIQRALSVAFGEDDFLGVEEEAPKPFAAPEFIGNTDALSVPELIGFFQLQGKTGVLTIDARQEQFSLEYLRGELIHAGSTSSPDGQRLGEVLVKLGHLTQSKLERLLAGKSSAERLGDALRRGEVVGEEALAEALQYQIQNIFYRLFDLKGCRFTFREGLEGEPRARVRYNVTRLLLETARHRDELEGQEERRAG